MITRRRTKIVVTLGPALDDDKVLERTFLAGADVFRANFSHGSPEEHAKRISKIRALSKKHNREVAVFADLQGPKIRIARFKNEKVILKENAKFILDATLDDDAGNEQMVGIDYKELPKDVEKEDTLLLDDGRIVFKVLKKEGSRVFCRVVVGGELSNNKGINRLGGGLSAKALTEKDKEDIRFAAKLEVDYFAISFPRSAADIEEAKTLIAEAGSSAGVISKIERVEAVQAIDEIIHVSDGVMVARGDLGVEIGDAQLPAVQKQIIQRARGLDKPVITATQMMESMIHNMIPTRAEVFDVANAVLDNTDAVMLSAETAAGEHPDVVVATMARVCLGAEKQLETQVSKHRLECRFNTIDEAIAMSAMYCANHVDIAAIVCLTESGQTPLLMSRIRTGIPIFALSRFVATQRKTNLYRGVHPIAFDATKMPSEKIDQYAIQLLKDEGILKNDDLVIITKGDIIGISGHTNSMKIHKVS
ncbi:MAG: pyruvate kinase [Gammaproteobacteria bacterium]|nr:pyruvate kinase [Gammaproteobacteria bacterium]